MTLSITVVADLLLGDVGRVLRRDDHGVHAHRLIAVVLDRDLALAVGPQPVDLAAAPHRGQAAGEAVRQHDRQRHQLGGLVAGEAEHQALVAGAAGVHPHARCRATGGRS